MKVQVGKYNNYTYALDTTAKTLTISGEVGIDITTAMLSSVWDTTASKFITGSPSVSKSNVAGLHVWTFTYTSLPSGVANSDVLVILINLPEFEQYASIYDYLAAHASPPAPVIFVPAVDNLWASYDMTLPAGVVTSGANVTQVKDNSGNNRNLTKTDGAFPTYSTGAFNSIVCSAAGDKQIYQDGFSLTGPISMYAIVKQTGFEENGSLLSIGPIWNALRQETKDSFPCLRPTRFAVSSYYSRNGYNSDWQVLSVVFNEDNSYMRINNQFKDGPFSVGTNSNVVDTIALGKTGSEADMQVAQWHIIAGVLNDTQDAYMIAQMNARINPPYHDQVQFFGDSITQGSGPYTFSSIWVIYAQLTAFELGRNIYNHAISGSRVFNYPNPDIGIDLVDVYTQAMTVPPQGWIFVAYGVNDALVFNGTNPHDSDYVALWKAQLKTIIQAWIAYGYDPQKIIISTTGYEPTRPLCALFRAPIAELGTELGIRTYDAWAYTLANGGPTYCADNTHPDEAGHRVLANGAKLAFA